MTEVVSESSPLWDSLLRRYTVLLQHPQIPGTDDTNAAMLKSIRLGHAVDRCNLKLSRDVTMSVEGYGPVKPQRHNLVVTGARRSGVSSLVRMLVKGLPEGASQLSSSQDMMIHSFRAQLGGSGVMARVVDKRSTAISTPLSASLYKGPTACFFVFDAERMDETLTEAAWCIEELRTTVGAEKFNRIPKLLVCHKADLIPSSSATAGLEELDAPVGVASLTPMCKHLLAAYQMDLVMTTIKDQSSVDVAFALAAEQWPQQESNVDDHVPPLGSALHAHRASLWPTRTRVSSHPVVSSAIQPGTRRPGNLFEELQSRVTRQN